MNNFKQIFPLGQKNDAYAQYFTGQSYVAMLTTTGVPCANVTFEPGCRNNWHIHHKGGQILFCTAGEGWYQEKWKPAQLLKPGDVVNIPPEVAHWHGATKDSWFAHIAISVPADGASTEWLEPVADKEYLSLEDMKEIYLTETAVKNHNELWPDYDSKAAKTDPELIEIFDNWAFDEVIAQSKIDTKTRVMMIMGSCIAQGALTEYKIFVNAALNVGVSPVEVKEILYQSAAYVGMAKVIDFLYAANEIMQDRSIALPLEKQSTTTRENRFEKGLAVQKSIFGEMIDKMRENAPKDQLPIQDYLSDNCFGDYYTRTGLDMKNRELLTYSILISMGGTDSQVRGHIQGNLNVGNNRETLVGITTQLLPYIGYPRTLNAMNAINDVIPTKK